MSILTDKKLAGQIVNTVKDVCERNVNFIDRSGIIFASTDEKRIGMFHEIGLRAASEGCVIEVDEDDSFSGTQKGVNLPIYYKHALIAVIGITGPPDEVRKYAHLAERITHLLIREKELHAFNRSQDEKRHYVIESLIDGGNLDDEYLVNTLSEWDILKAGSVRILLIQINARYSLENFSMWEQKLHLLFQQLNIRLHTFHYPNEYLAVIDEISFQSNEHILRKFSDSYTLVFQIAIGKCCPLYQLSDSYDTALNALNSLSRFGGNYAVFDHLTLEIILSSLHITDKEAYIEKTLSALSEQDISLLSVYFSEDMSLSRTCEKLFLHKNTVQNKLDRISQKSGYNPRKFRDAVILYLAVKLV